MAKGPLITRSELRKRQEEREHYQAKQEKQQLKAHEQDYRQKSKEIDRFYRKEQKKNQPLKKTRSGEQSKMRERNTFLNKAIILVVLVLVIVGLLVLFV